MFFADIFLEKTQLRVRLDEEQNLVIQGCKGNGVKRESDSIDIQQFKIQQSHGPPSNELTANYSSSSFEVNGLLFEEQVVERMKANRLPFREQVFAKRIEAFDPTGF